MDKSPEAFRTISEVADLLDTPAHVLRFWESRFPQIRPVKRAGGRRYYRPADVALLTGIKRLLHDEGMTIRGVQKILREQGVRHVAGLTEDAAQDDDAEAALEAAMSANFPPDPDDDPLPHAAAETAQIVALESALRREGGPRRPAQENLFADLFEMPAAAPLPELVPGPDTGPAAAGDEPFAEVAETVAFLQDEAAATPAGADEWALPATATATAPPDGPAAADDEAAAGRAETVIFLPEAPGAAPADPAAEAAPEPVEEVEEAPFIEVPDSEEPELPPPVIQIAPPARPAVAAAGLAARIAALSPAAAGPHRETLRALRDRLIALQERMTAPPY